jgi:hypothetical protein
LYPIFSVDRLPIAIPQESLFLWPCSSQLLAVFITPAIQVILGLRFFTGIGALQVSFCFGRQ